MSGQNERQKAMMVLCGILQASGGSLTGKIRLYKAFYRAHLNYWRDQGEVLTRYPIVRMPMGPGIHEADALIAHMAATGQIRHTVGTPGREREERFELLGDCAWEKDSPEYESIKAAAEWANGLEGHELSELTHQTSRSWQEAVDGEELDIYADEADPDRVQRVRETAAHYAEVLAREP